MDSQSYALGDLGAAVLSICLEATSLGLGTCILGLYERERLRELLDISRDKHFAGLISVGYPASDKIRPKIRKQMEEIVRFI